MNQYESYVNSELIYNAHTNYFVCFSFNFYIYIWNVHRLIGFEDHDSANKKIGILNIYIFLWLDNFASF